MVALIPQAIWINSAAKPPDPLVIGGTPELYGYETEQGGAAYPSWTVTYTGGVPPYTFSVVAGTLPSGITLNSSTGVMSGSPTIGSEGVYSGIVVRVTDGIGGTSNLAAFTITIVYADDYYATYTKLLMNPEGANGSSTFTDLSQTAATITVQGSTTMSTAQAKFGSSSIDFSGGFKTLTVLATPAAVLPLLSAPFTLEFILKFQSVGGDQAVLWCFNNPYGWYIRFTGGVIDFGNAQGTGGLANNWSPGTSVFHEVRIAFDGSVIRMFLDGVLQPTAITGPQNGLGGTDNLLIGGQGTSSRPLMAWVDGVRITHGICRSTASYTPQTRPYPTISGVVITAEAAKSVYTGLTLAHSLTASQTVTWSIAGGADAAQFEVSGSTLRWLSNGTRAYGSPQDVGANNVYNVIVRASNATTHMFADLAIAITVTNLWIPSIVNPTLWNDVDNLTGSDGASLAAWPDLSGNGNSPTVTGPVVRTNALNGYPVVEFDGSNDVVAYPNFMAGSSSGCMMAIVKLNAQPGDGNGWESFGTDAQLEHTPYSDGSLYTDWGTTSRRSKGSIAAFSLASWAIWWFESAPGSWKVYFNGTQFTATDTSNTVAFANNPILGAGGSNYRACRIAAVMLKKNAVLSTTDRQQLEGHWAHKFGIASVLPVGHPYKSAPP